MSQPAGSTLARIKAKRENSCVHCGEPITDPVRGPWNTAQEEFWYYGEPVPRGAKFCGRCAVNLARIDQQGRDADSMGMGLVELA